MAISLFEMKQIAELKGHPGYILLMEAMQAELDTLSDELLASEPQKEGQILGKWRAFKDIFTRLKTVPEEYALELSIEAPTPGDPDNIFTRVAPRPKIEWTQEAIDLLTKVYEEKKNKINV